MRGRPKSNLHPLILLSNRKKKRNVQQGCGEVRFEEPAGNKDHVGENRERWKKRMLKEMERSRSKKEG
jgi:hypothetical protein